MAGVILIGYAAVGLTGPTLFEMHQRMARRRERGTTYRAHGRPRAAHAARDRFRGLRTGEAIRIYSFVTLLAMILFGALAAPYGARLAAGEPTPGFGLVERISVYSSLLWIAVVSITLMRRVALR